MTSQGQDAPFHLHSQSSFGRTLHPVLLEPCKLLGSASMTRFAQDCSKTLQVNLPMSKPEAHTFYEHGQVMWASPQNCAPHREKAK